MSRLHRSGIRGTPSSSRSRGVGDEQVIQRNPEHELTVWGEGRRPPPHGRISFDDFMAWLDEPTRAEWSDGEVTIMSPSNWQHQDLQLLLAAVLRWFVDGSGIGRVIAAPYQVKLPGPRGPSREPDILYISSANPGIVHPTFFEGSPDLAVEIVSPDSVSRDHVDKFREYERAGVQEYWIIDPQNSRAALFSLSPAGKFEPLPQTDGVFSSRVLNGFQLRVDALWRQPLPGLRPLLDEMGLL